MLNYNGMRVSGPLGVHLYRFKRFQRSTEKSRIKPTYYITMEFNGLRFNKTSSKAASSLCQLNKLVAFLPRHDGNICLHKLYQISVSQEKNISRPSYTGPRKTTTNIFEYIYINNIHNWANFEGQQCLFNSFHASGNFSAASAARFISACACCTWRGSAERTEHRPFLLVPAQKISTTPGILLEWLLRVVFQWSCNKILPHVGFNGSHVALSQPANGFTSACGGLVGVHLLVVLQRRRPHTQSAPFQKRSRRFIVARNNVCRSKTYI